MTQVPTILKLRESIPSAPKLPDSFTPITLQQAADLLSRWSFERKAYPGWVVAPEDKRVLVWMDTRRWMHHLSNDLKDWNSVDRLLLFRELNWRLDTSMVPLFTDVLVSFRQTISDLFDDLLNYRELKGSPELLRGKKVSSSELLHAWLEVAFGLLREARETYNADYWNEIHNNIKQLISREEQYKDRFYYEQILSAIWNVDRERAKELLSNWLPSPAKPLATIWKAGLLAELNELGEARDLLRNTLREIRNSQQLLGQNIHLFSLEGWCTYLIVAVEMSLDFARGTNVKREFRERWQALKSWDCDPWLVKDSLEVSLSKPAPIAKESTSRIQGFDPGQVSISYNLFSDNTDDYLPAFAYIRFFEQAGIPMRLEILNIAGNELKDACGWIAPFINYWSPAILVRAGKLEALKKDYTYLSRNRVALMEKELVTRLYNWCIGIWDRETNDIVGMNAARRDKDLLLSCLVEILSRLACRLDEGQLNETFRRALEIQPWIGNRGYLLYSGLQDWFRRIFDSATPQVLLSWFPKLLAAPLVQGLSVSDNEWINALVHYPWWRIKNILADSSTEQNLEESINWLLRKAASETGAARERALIRIADVYSAGLLSQNQSEAFANILWSERNENGLPAVSSFSWFAFASLPSPPTIDVQNVLKQNILEQQPFFTGGGIGAFEVDPLSSFIVQSAHNTKPPYKVLNEGGGILEWSKEDANTLYLRALEWWPRAKQMCEQTSPFQQVDKERMGRILAEFIRCVIVPSIDEQESRTWEDLTNWIEDLRMHEIYVTPALPYFFAKEHTNLERFYEQLLNDLNGTDDGAIAAAAKAVRHFVAVHTSQLLPHTYLELTTLLVERFIFRRKPALHACISQLQELIAQFPDSINESAMTFLIASLRPWFDKLPLESSGDNEFAESERPTYRIQVCSMAGTLSALHDFKGISRSESIEIWRKASESDPLPELRRSFSDGRAIFDEARKEEQP